jgi:hypothetical protein
MDEPLTGESRCYSNDGDRIASVSEHIRKGVFVVYECNYYDGDEKTVTIWSLLTGSLVCSFQRDFREYVTSISEDNRFIVTNNVHKKLFNIYCMETGSHLYTYQPQGLKSNSDVSTILFVKLLTYQSYMLIMGTVTKEDEEPHQDSRFFFFIF